MKVSMHTLSWVDISQKNLCNSISLRYSIVQVSAFSKHAFAVLYITAWDILEILLKFLQEQQDSH